MSEGCGLPIRKMPQRRSAAKKNCFADRIASENAESRLAGYCKTKRKIVSRRIQCLSKRLRSRLRVPQPTRLRQIEVRPSLTLAHVCH